MSETENLGLSSLSDTENTEEESEIFVECEKYQGKKKIPFFSIFLILGIFLFVLMVLSLILLLLYISEKSSNQELTKLQEISFSKTKCPDGLSECYIPTKKYLWIPNLKDKNGFVSPPIDKINKDFPPDELSIVFDDNKYKDSSVFLKSFLFGKKEKEKEVDWGEKEVDFTKFDTYTFLCSYACYGMDDNYLTEQKITEEINTISTQFEYARVKAYAQCAEVADVQCKYKEERIRVPVFISVDCIDHKLGGEEELTESQKFYQSEYPEDYFDEREHYDEKTRKGPYSTDK